MDVDESGERFCPCCDRWTVTDEAPDLEMSAAVVSDK
jgi:hypothetical protein